MVTLIVSDGKAETRRSILLRALLEPIEPVLRIELTPSFPPVPGQSVLVTVQADSLSEIVATTLTLDGVPLVLDANNRATVIAGVPGKYVLTATTRDADGGSKTVTRQIKVRDPADASAPAVAFNPGTDGLLVAGPLAIGGLIDDSNLDFWTLELVARDGSVTELARGEAALAGDLGALDGRRLADGFYTLLLTARDISGRTSVTSADIEINSGSEKLGRHLSQLTNLRSIWAVCRSILFAKYDSIDSEWSFLTLDMRVEADVDGVPEGSGSALPWFAQGTRVYATLPNGVSRSLHVYAGG